MLCSLFPSELFAEGNDPFYDASGLNANRDTLSISDFEHIDPFTGGVTLRFEDVRLPGNGGLDLVVQRTFNSKNACRNWSQIIWNSQTVVKCNNALYGDSWVGNGWTMHFGKLLIGGTSYIIEMPDGSTHETYLKAGSSDRITKDYWILQWVSGTTYILKLTDGKKITFDYYGSKTSDGLYNEYYASKIEDANGNAITINYYDERDAWGFWINEYKGAIKSVTDSLGRVTNFSLVDSSNPWAPTLIEGKYRLREIIRPDGKKILFKYVSASSFPLENDPLLLTEVIPPEGLSWKYTYNAEYSYTTNSYKWVNDLLKVSTPYGGMIDYTYATEKYSYGSGDQFAARALKTKTASGRGIATGTWNFQYYQGTNNDITVVTDPCGRVTNHRHFGYKTVLNQNGSMWKIGLPISKETVGEETNAYEWIPSSLISYDDIIVSGVGTDSSIYVPYQSKQTITRGGQNYITTYSNFDSYGNPLSIVETGNATRNRALTYWYNTEKNIVAGKPATETVSGTLAGSFATNYAYNANGNLTQKNRYGIITSYAYYSNGNLYSQTDPKGNTTSYQWTNGRISMVTNPLYSVSRVINTVGTIASETNGRNFTTSYTYDGNLRLTGIIPPAGNPTYITYPTDNSFKTETRGGYWLKTTYDGIGMLNGTSDSRGVTNTVAYKTCGLKDYEDSNIGDKVFFDNFGRISKVLHKDSSQMLHAYSGNALTVTDEAGKNTTFNYNAFGSPDDKMLGSVKDALNNTTTYTRNILGSLTGITQGSVSRTFGYSTKNFLTSETNPETGSITYGRDNNGNMTSRADASGTVSYAYDQINRPAGITFGGESISFSYDNADNRTSMTSPGATATYAYDSANRMTSQTKTIGGRAYTTGYGYDGNDNLISLASPTGLAVSYAYNSNNQVTSATGFGGSATGITYNTAGLPTGFSYSNGRNTAISYSSRNLTTQINAGNAYNTSFSYDTRGNTTSITDNLPDTPILTRKIDPAKGAIQTTAYAYASNRMTALSGAETAAYSYNARGDMTSLTEQGTAFTPEYDLLHNLRAYKQGTNVIASYGYDGDGMRVLKTAGGTTTVYHHDKSGQLLSETDTAGNRIADYVYVNGNMAAKVESAGAVSYYHVDPAGTPVAITGSTGALLWRAEYLPFGEEQLLVNTKANDKMFIGKEKDKETGLYYFGARYMQDRNARFVSVDPVGPVDERTGKVDDKILLNPQMLNRYAYALNNPYKYYDPDGKFVFVLAPLAIPALEVLGTAVLGLTTFKVLEQAYKNRQEGMYNEGAGESASKGARTEPKDLQEKLTVDEAKGGAGEPYKGKKLGDPKYDPKTGTHDKKTHNHEHPDGTKTEVHYDVNRKTGDRSGFKIKDDTNARSRGHLNP